MKTDRPSGPVEHVEYVIYTWQKFLTASSVRASAHVVDTGGWGAAFLGVVVAALFRGVFNYLTDPLIVARGRPLGNVSVLALDVVFSFFFVLLTWVLFFGSVTALAGLVNRDIHFSLAAFRLGGYLSVVFVPIFLVGIALAVTIPVSAVTTDPAMATNATMAARHTVQAQLAIRSTPQMSFVRALRVVGWLVVAAFLVPAVTELYDMGRVRTTLAVVVPTAFIVMLTLVT